MSRYICSITGSLLKYAEKGCSWEGKNVVIPAHEEDITTYVEGFLSVYTYPFTLHHLDPVIINFFYKYKITLGQIHPSFWRIFILLRFFMRKVKGIPFSLNRLIRWYKLHLYWGGLIKLQCRTTKVLFSSINEDIDRGWMDWFVLVNTFDIIPVEKMPFPEK